MDIVNKSSSEDTGAPKSPQDSAASSVTGYIADISQHASRSVDEPQQGQQQEEGNANNSLLQQGSFGVSPVTDATSKATAAPVVAEDDEEEAVPDGGDGSQKDSKTSEKQEQQQTTAAPTFVNHGLAAWEQNRQKWLHHRVKNRTSKNNKNGEQPERHAIELNADEIIDVIFTSPRQLRMNGGVGRKFPQKVPLPQMVDILQDLWEAEGLDV